jgi:hypothetical protein
MDQRRRDLGSIGECGKRELNSYAVKREASRYAAGNLKQDGEVYLLSGAARTGVIRDRFHSLDGRVWLNALCESLETWEAFEYTVNARHAARVGQRELDLRFAEICRDDCRMNALENVGQRLFSAGSKCRVHGKVHRSFPFAASGSA